MLQPESIVGLLDRYPELFYRNNRDWFKNEPFARILPGETLVHAPTGRSLEGVLPKRAKLRSIGKRAVDIANCYVRSPKDPAWLDYLCTSDVDENGYMVYVGGCANGHGFEFHRWLLPTARLFVPVWK